MRSLVGLVLVLSLAAMGCSETSGPDGGGGTAGMAGESGSGGVAGVGGDGGGGQTGEIAVRVNPEIDFSQVASFSVVTAETVNSPDIDRNHQSFNDRVNELIIDAMRSEPVCLEHIPAEDAGENPPDLWASNGLGLSERSEDAYECCGGWWWGYWGWFWGACGDWCPEYLGHEAGALFIPVGFDAEDPAVFSGLALGSGEAGASAAVREIFRAWPDKRSCSALE